MPDPEEWGARYKSDPRATEELIALALSKDMDEDGHDFWIPVWTLQHRLPELFPRIQELSKTSDVKSRIAAASILGQNVVRGKVMARECTEALNSMLAAEIDLDPFLLNSVISALGHLKESGLVDTVLPYSAHRDPGVRFAVACTLGCIEDERAISALIVLSRDADRDVRNWATFGLGSLIDSDSEEIRAALVDRLNEKDDEIREEALLGLVKRRDCRAIEPLGVELVGWRTAPLIKDCADELIERKKEFGPAWQAIYQTLKEIGFTISLKIPDLSLVVLIGASGSGKSTFARKHFKPTEILSSDYCRGLVSDDENNQAATKDAFEVLHFVAAKRLAAGRLTVVDATNLQPEARKPLVALAREYHCLPVAIVLNLPEKICHERNRTRPERDFGPHVVRQQTSQLRQSLRNPEREGFRHVHILNSIGEIEAAEIKREPLWNNRKSDHGPFDIIGDVHGCFDEMIELLEKLGYKGMGGGVYVPPVGRRLIFVGDLVDRGPKSPEVVRLVMDMSEAGYALALPGNHDIKFMRAIRGKKVQISHGLDKSLEQFAVYETRYPGLSLAAADFIDSLVSHYVFNDGKLVVAHAGMKEAMQGRGSGKVREFALYGETTGETDEFGLPVRYPWAQEYRGRAIVVYGHTPVPEPEWLNRTIDIDTGCVFGGKLTALRYPEQELVSVPARQTYAQPARPFLPIEEHAAALTLQQSHDDILDLADIMGKRFVSARLQQNITIREENGIAALEVMSRFAVNPKWLIYLPPTMSPSETSKLPDLLEHPSEAFAYFRQESIPKVICEEKHMGSRAVVVICRDEETTVKRFGIAPEEGEGCGVIYTRTGRRFFEERAVEEQLLNIIRSAMDAAGFWEEFGTGWACLDCELMPWSAKAQELIRTQYAAVGAASESSLACAVEVTSAVANRGPDFLALAERTINRSRMASLFRDSYRRYCWPVHSVIDYRIAPFHLLATEGGVHVGKDHVWHLETLARVCGQETRAPVMFSTPYQIIDVTDEASQRTGTSWWEAMTSRGGEGMVVKPLDFVAKGRRGLAQPAVKCRGREYLRIIYGPEYTDPANLVRLKSRGLGAKRSLAIREFALGIEALERFVGREPLRRVHECVVGVLALESEPVDPRL